MTDKLLCKWTIDKREFEIWRFAAPWRDVDFYIVCRIVTPECVEVPDINTGSLDTPWGVLRSQEGGVWVYSWDYIPNEFYKKAVHSDNIEWLKFECARIAYELFNMEGA